MDPYNSRSPAPAHTDRTYTIVGTVQVLAEQADDLHASLAMVMQEFHQVFAPYQRYSRAVQQFGGHLMGASRQACAKAQYLSRPRDAESQTTACFRAHEEPSPAFAKHKNSLGR